jgi:hypothetical protein
MSKIKTLPAALDRIREQEELIEDMQSQNEALVFTCDQRLERIGELVARVEQLDALHSQVLTENAKLKADKYG